MTKGRIFTVHEDTSIDEGVQLVQAQLPALLLYFGEWPLTDCSTVLQLWRSLCRIA